MFKTMFSKGILPVAETMASFAEQRHAVLANNIANIDTPYYKARDLHLDEFRKALGKAIDQRRTGNPRLWNMRGTSHVHFDAMGTFGSSLRVDSKKVHDINILAHDQNKRSIETEMSELAKNQALHRVMNALEVQEFAAIEGAIKERA